MADIFDLIKLPLYHRGSLFGASLVAAEFDESQVVIWGPRGCSSQVLDAQYNQRRESHFRHYLTSEVELITDGIKGLRRELLAHIAAYSVTGPLFLFLGDAPKLTYEDIEGFIESEVSPEFPIVYVETGFGGDWYKGINETLYKIVQRFCKPKPVLQSKPKLVNLIPDVGTSPQWRGNAEELSRLLTKIGFQVNIVASQSEIQDIENLTNASYTFLINPQIGQKAAEYLQKNFDIPALIPKNIPLGISGTKLWLKEVIEFTGLYAPEVDDIIEQEKSKFFITMRPGLKDENYNLKISMIKKKKFLICDEFHRAVQWSRLLLQEVNFKGGYIFPTEGFDESASYDLAGVEVIKDIRSLMTYCEDENIALILGSDWIEELLQRKVDNLVITNNPVLKKITFISKPYYGFHGLLYFLEDALNSIHY